MKTYAERIRRLRKGRGLSQEELAARLGVSRSAVGMYETGKREPDFATGEAIADLFDVDMTTSWAAPRWKGAALPRSLWGSSGR